MAMLLRNMLFREALSSAPAGRESVSQIAAGQLRTMHGVGFGLVNPCEVSRAGVTRPFDNAICYP